MEMALNYLSYNINLLMKENNVSASQLARDTLLPLSSIKKMRKGTNSNPTIATLLPVALYFNIQVEDLVSANIKNSNSTTSHHIPVITWEESLLWPNILTSKHSTILSELDASNTAFALRVEADDWGIFSNGSLLLIFPSLNPSHRDHVIVYKNGMQRPTLKKFLQEEEKIFLQSISISSNLDILTTEYQIIGVAVEHRQMLKRNSSTQKVPVVITNNNFLNLLEKTI